MTQAENALFLDDDADWASQLDDMEIEAAQASASASASVSANANTSANVCASGSGSAYVIEEEFAPYNLRNVSIYLLVYFCVYRYSVFSEKACIDSHLSLFMTFVAQKTQVRPGRRRLVESV